MATIGCVFCVEIIICLMGQFNYLLSALCCVFLKSLVTFEKYCWKIACCVHVFIYLCIKNSFNLDKKQLCFNYSKSGLVPNSRVGIKSGTGKTRIHLSLSWSSDTIMWQVILRFYLPLLDPQNLRTCDALVTWGIYCQALFEKDDDACDILTLNVVFAEQTCWSDKHQNHMALTVKQKLIAICFHAVFFCHVCCIINKHVANFFFSGK